MTTDNKTKKSEGLQLLLKVLQYCDQEATTSYQGLGLFGK